MAVSVAFVAMWSDAPMLMMLPDSPRSRLLRSLLRHILQAWRAAAACYARLDTGVPGRAGAGRSGARLQFRSQKKVLRLAACGRTSMYQ